MAEKKLVRTGTKWEPLVGYSRAVRVGPHVALSGCAPVDSSCQLVGADDPYLQTKRRIEIIAAALEEADAIVGEH